MTSKNIFAAVIFALLFAVNFSAANNIQVSSATLTGQNTTDNYTNVQFNLSWDNSWRDNINWDAAWVFVKYKVSYDSLWRPAWISSTQANHIVPAGYTAFPSSGDGLGVFIYRSSSGSGNVNLSSVQLRWEYNVNGLNDADVVEVKVFAVEMVFVPTGPFYAGDGNLSPFQQFSQGQGTQPFFITGEIAYTLGGSPLTNIGNRNAQTFSGTADDFNSVTTQTLPAAFPKGYTNFYCMKYEISQGQYTDFLNTLTRFQQKTRVTSNISTGTIANFYVMTNTNFAAGRNKIVCPNTGNGTTEPIVFSCDRPDRACNYLSWMDGAAYLDWSGLRPCSDLEYEKLSRGPILPFPQEFAWGTANVTCALNISGAEDGTETVDAGSNCNCNNLAFNGGDGSNGPLRVGIFATGSSSRIQSGATYYGIMNISDNLQERTVTVGNAQGRTFNGLHGDGNLSVNGNANVNFWPGNVASEVTGATGSGVRGGSFANLMSDAYYLFQTSGRTLASNTNTTRQVYYGFRGVHSAPFGTSLLKQGKF